MKTKKPKMMLMSMRPLKKLLTFVRSFGSLKSISLIGLFTWLCSFFLQVFFSRSSLSVNDGLITSADPYEAGSSVWDVLN
jgi:hypothetical protein